MKLLRRLAAFRSWWRGYKDWRVRYPDGGVTKRMRRGDAAEYKKIYGGYVYFDPI